ncbi:hypothetical protein FOZ62_028130, partial [Perkinsus olseni]
AFKDFDVETLVRQASEATSIDELVDAVVEGDFDVVSSRRKIESVYRNAEAARTVQGEYGSLCEYIWHFTEGRQVAIMSFGGHPARIVVAVGGLDDEENGSENNTLSEPRNYWTLSERPPSRCLRNEGLKVSCENRGESITLCEAFVGMQ